MTTKRTSRLAKPVDIALGLCALSPLLVAVALAAVRPEVTPVADHAVMELYVSQAGESPLTVGPYSRFGWHHPGPALFYALLPGYAFISGGG